MPIITQLDFYSFPIVNTRRQCPSGDYSLIKYFGDACNFGNNCVFSRGSRFLEACLFGDFCSFSDGCVLDESCIIGDYSMFGEQCTLCEKCKIGEYVSFGEHCTFGNACTFGPNCTFGCYAYFNRSCFFDECCLFGAFCTFGEACKIDQRCIFGPYCSFGSKCIIENVELIARSIYMVSGFGSCHRATYAYPGKEVLMIRCGCWIGSLDQFRARVKGEYGEKHEYLLVADLFEARWKRSVA